MLNSKDRANEADVETAALLPACPANILEVVPERPSIKYFNLKYVKWGNFTITRYGRRSLYYLNIEEHIKHSWGNNGFESGNA
ncbi:hypothetical protein EVAR_27337_1 [Eumeta japonica]|uniref:Uncharacterized protein n=1 Tax=Eumeta variegata TaxID=151549 RepID=A0A4C1UC96_EUMVA|nr:hypothetical protein EVAR_27337_1 [Eumeta japonica]